jgi:3-methyladenine DNA glycosylase AlkD
MCASWADDARDRAAAALAGHRDPERAAGAAAYMRHIAPFLGISAPDRRRLLRAAWSSLAEPPASDDLGHAARALMACREREFHYAAYDLVGRFIGRADEHFLGRHLEALLTTTPWWDTVDGFGTAAVSPLCRRYGHRETVDAWSESGDIWLVRAAIQHQRGWKEATDVDRVLSLCDRHWASEEFFVAKAIGWALRDLARLDPAAVRAFLRDHPLRNRVAEREAHRGLRS